MNISIQELSDAKKKTSGKYEGTTTYNVQGTPYEVPPWSHPASIANDIINVLQHTKFYLMQIVAPPGHGKTTFAKVITHHIHTKHPDFKIKWAGSLEFTQQRQFFESLPKYPHIVIFDDISAALGQMSEKEVEKNFEALTTVRWILDPVEGKIPIIIMTTSHYSKKVEKSIRAQSMMTVFAAFGNEERTNIDTLAEKGSLPYKTLKNYGYLYTKMLREHKFHLPLPSGIYLEYQTDKPFRVACSISKLDAKLTLYSDKDECDICSKKKLKKQIPPKELYDRVIKAYGRYGEQVLRHALFKRGYRLAIHPEAAIASAFIEDLLSKYTTDYESLWKLFYTEKHQKVPDRLYRKRKQESEIMGELDKVSVELPAEPQIKTEEGLDDEDE